MLNYLDGLLKEAQNFSEYSRAFVTIAAAVGALILIVGSLKLMIGLYSGFRLYVWSQFSQRASRYSKQYGQWAVVSGATDGIGLSMAKQLAKRGHSIVVIGRNPAKLAHTKAALQEELNCGEIVTVQIDLSDSTPENYYKIRDQIDPDKMDVGILVNNAGVAPDAFGRFASHDMDTIHNQVNVNVLAPLYLTRMILPGMIKRRRGLILNVSSTCGYVPFPYTSVYPATKAFMNHFSRNLQGDYRSHPIDVINLSPGFVRTKMCTDNFKNIQNPNFFFPTPDNYARTVLNAASTRVNSMAGNIGHEIFLKVCQLGDYLGLLHYSQKLFRRISGAEYLHDCDAI